jgi:hypothetical protein
VGRRVHRRELVACGLRGVVEVVHIFKPLVIPGVYEMTQKYDLETSVQGWEEMPWIKTRWEI